MSIGAVHPNEVLEALLSKGARRDKQEKLKKLNELCSLEYSRHSQGARDLSVSNISKVAEMQGLFKARTIYNAQSEDYVILITAWGNYNGPKESQVIKDKLYTAEKYAFLKKIDDPAVRSLCQMAFAERDKFRTEINLLKSKSHVIVDMRPLGAEIAKRSRDVAVIEAAAQLTDSEKNALTLAISPKFLSERKWSVGPSGEIFDERGRFVFMPGFVSSIKKILRN